MSEKRVHCAWCGEYLGTYETFDPNEETCGSIECDREIRNMEREAEAEREERAQADGYSRY